MGVGGEGGMAVGDQSRRSSAKGGLTGRASFFFLLHFGFLFPDAEAAVGLNRGAAAAEEE